MVQRKKKHQRYKRVLRFYMPVAIFITAVALTVFYTDHQHREKYEEERRTVATEVLATVRAKLQGSLQSNIQLIQGLVAIIEAEPEMTQERFSGLSGHIFETAHQLRLITAAPGLVVRYVYPYASNTGAIGIDLRRYPDSSAMAYKVRDTGEMSVVGPIELNNRGQSMLVRYPVTTNASNGGRTFWGVISAIIDIEALYQLSGLTDPDNGFDIAIRIVPPGKEMTEAFFGQQAVFQNRPVLMNIAFADLTWQMAAVPTNGWDIPASNLWSFRAMLLVLASLIIAPVVWVMWLLGERQLNIAALRQRESELHSISHRLDLALNASHIGVWDMDLETQELQWDHRMRELYGLEPNHPSEYRVWREILHPDDLATAERIFARAIENGQNYVTEFRIITPAREIRHIRAFGTSYRDPKGGRRMVGVNWDVTADVLMRQALEDAKIEAERQNEALELARQQMEHDSLHDTLTQLPNRRYLDQKLANLSAIGTKAAPITVLHIDLDRFKYINDTLGHGAGDAILMHVSRQLKQTVHRNDFVARIGGDEFVVISPTALETETFTEYGNRLIAAISMPIIHAGHECRVGASIGVATRLGTEIDAAQLLVNADIALYEAKRRGRNRVEPFNDQLRLRTINIKKTADDILSSLERQDFIAYFQPQFCAQTLAINGAEALARWRHPSRGMLSPDAFLESAESLAVISQIDAAILEQSLLQLARWKAHNLGIERVSVNISAQRLADETLLQKLDTLQISPSTLSFELLESISFDDTSEIIRQNIERIRAYGIDIEIDDFGTGHASILSLQKLKPTRLKIDRQLTADVVHSPAQRQLIASIVEIGRTFDIEIVAEGVETMAHAHVLRDLGCNTLQGYALARPMAANDLITFARSYVPGERLRRSA